MHQDLLIHTEAGVTTITFNRVEKKTLSPRPCTPS